VVAVYWNVQNNEFIIPFDDQQYVTQNVHVQKGLNCESIRWAFTSTTDAGFWHPLTWLTLMLDYQLYGLNARGYHWTNLLLHILSTLLLFSVLNRMTDLFGGVVLLRLCLLSIPCTWSRWLL